MIYKKNVESIMKQHEDGDDRSFVDIYLNEMTKRQKNIFNKDDETTFSGNK